MKRFFLFAIGLCAVALAARADVLGEYVFEGSLGDKVPVEISFCVNGDDIAVGEIKYTKLKNPQPILIVGHWGEDGLSLTEYLRDGTVTGLMFMRIEDEGHGPYIDYGYWTNPKTGTQLKMKNMICTEVTVDVPRYLAYEKPEWKRQKYVYRQWDKASQTMKVGTVQFNNLGDHKMHFEVNDEVRGSGFSTPENRPAVLGDYTYDYFIYENVNECGYSVSAHFFKDFVLFLRTSEQYTRECGGKSYAIEGCYIKVDE